jgi:hypothetical protein
MVVEEGNQDGKRDEKKNAIIALFLVLLILLGVTPL